MFFIFIKHALKYQREIKISLQYLRTVMSGSTMRAQISSSNTNINEYLGLSLPEHNIWSFFLIVASLYLSDYAELIVPVKRPKDSKSNKKCLHSSILSDKSNQSFYPPDLQVLQSAKKENMWRWGDEERRKRF